VAQRKVEDFNAKDRKVAELAKALAHPARVAIVRELAARGTCVCGEIVAVMPLAQSTVSQHLKELKAAGIIKGEVDGAKSCYCLDWDRIKDVWMIFHGMFAEMERNRVEGCC
jgi:ArsR family transcriptional regulator